MAFSFFGNQAPLDPMPKESDFYAITPDGDDTKLDFDEWQMYQAKLKQWKAIKDQREERKGIYQKMAQHTGDLAPAFTTSMPKREAPEFVAAGRGPVDILAPEVESIDDLYRKRPNMFRMI